MKQRREFITKGMYVSGISNVVGVLLFSRFFTNATINEADPNSMSNFGLLMIVVWGLVFLATASKWEQSKWMIGAFAVEKLVYGISWTLWLSSNDLSAVYDKDTMAGIFYTIYGPNDWLFFIFYLSVFVYLIKLENNTVKP